MLVAILVVGVGPLRADSTPVIAGAVRMIELCPQEWCGVAIFVGVFQGRIGANPRAIGTVAVAVNHDPLPTVPGTCAGITRGVWSLQTLGRSVGGGAVGQLCANPGLTFQVNVRMQIGNDSSNNLGFTGILDHNPFPPTLNGILFQPGP
jgi:hypothetical protein